jgi:hypothetical protein
MRIDCNCYYCKGEVNEYFCISCGFNFNECESFLKFDGKTFCPKCCPKKEEESFIDLTNEEFEAIVKNWDIKI